MLKQDKNLWCYIDGDYASEYFLSKEDALNDWLKNRKDKDFNVVTIGHPCFYVPIVDSFDVIENIQNQAFAETDGYSEDDREYLCHIRAEHLEELQDTLTNAFWEWQDIYGYGKEMYVIEKPERYVLMPNGEFCRIRKKDVDIHLD